MDARLFCSKTQKHKTWPMSFWTLWRRTSKDHHSKELSLWALWAFIIKVILLESCFGIQVVNQPKSHISVVEGEPIELDCKFNTAVHCVWFKNDSHVKIVGRYRYKDYQSKNPSDNCSIIIRKSTLYDRGQWHCSNMADSTGNPVITSLNSTVNIEEMKVVVNPQSLSERRGANATLNCKFNTRVNCSWNINGISMTSDGYYVYSHKHGRKTKDCSITLTDIKKFKHQGNWTCSSMVTDDIPKGVTSANATVYIEDPKLVVQPPKQIKVRQNDQVNLNCIFDTAVNCHWAINGESPQVDLINYLHNNGRSTEDCSIKIEEFHENHVGNWRCEDPEDHTIASHGVSLALEPHKKPSFQCTYVDLDQLQRRSRSHGTPEDDKIHATCHCHGSKADLHWELQTDSQDDQEYRTYVYYHESESDKWNSSLSLTCKEHVKLVKSHGSFTLFCVVSHPRFEIKLPNVFQSPCNNSVTVSTVTSDGLYYGYNAVGLVIQIISISLLVLLLF